MQNNKKYQEFKLEWMLDHGYTLEDMISILKEIYYENKDMYDEEFPLEEVFQEFEEEIGFDGSQIYPSYNEYLSEEKINKKK